MYEHFLGSSGLSVERLHALVLLKEHGSLIKAANGDASRQSRYSHHIRELSAFMGTALTIRDGKSIRLTPAGEELVGLAQSHFQALLEFQSRSKGTVRQVVIGAGDSLLQWLLLPILGAMRNLGQKQMLKIENVRTTDLVRRLQDQRLDFGLVRLNAIPRGLAHVAIGTVRHVVVVPRRLASRHMDLGMALLECPHATVGGDGELVQKLRTLAAEHGGSFRPALVCDSISQCIAAVKTGGFAAVLLTQAWEQVTGLECEVLNDKELAELDRPIGLAWSPRNLEAIGPALDSFRKDLLAALVEEAVRIGLIENPGEANTD